MCVVYYKGVFDQTFASLIDAEKYVHDQLDNDWSKSEEDYAYSFY